MTAPLIFMATNRLEPGALAAERDRVPELARRAMTHDAVLVTP